LALKTSGSFTANGQNSASVTVKANGYVTVDLSGTFVMTVGVFISNDGGTTWIPKRFENSATVMSFTNAGRQLFLEAVPGTLIRLSTTAFTSGTCAYRVYVD